MENHLITIGLCLIWCRITIFSLGVTLCYSIISGGLTYRSLLHHVIVQKKVDELLAKGAIEPSSIGVGFSSNIFVVPKHTGNLSPVFNFKHFNHCMYIPTFKMPTIKQVWLLVQPGDYAFSSDLKDVYLHFPIVKHHHNFLQFVWLHWLYQWTVLPFVLATTPGVFSTLSPYCSFVITRICVLLFTWMISWSLLTPSMLARQLILSCAHFWFHLCLDINFSKSNLHLMQCFLSFVPVLEYSRHVSLSAF